MSQGGGGDNQHPSVKKNGVRVLGSPITLRLPQDFTVCSVILQENSMLVFLHFIGP